MFLKISKLKVRSRCDAKWCHSVEEMSAIFCLTSTSGQHSADAIVNVSFPLHGNNRERIPKTSQET